MKAGYLDTGNPAVIVRI